MAKNKGNGGCQYHYWHADYHGGRHDRDSGFQGHVRLLHPAAAILRLKHMPQGAPLAFGGGGGAGVTVSPVCFPDYRYGRQRQYSRRERAGLDNGRPPGRNDPGAINKVSSFVEGYKGKAGPNMDRTAEADE